MRIFITTIFCLIVVNCYAQSKKHYTILVSYATGIGNFEINNTEFTYEGYAASVKLARNIFKSKKVVLQTSVSLEGYHNPNFNLLPLSFSTSIKLLENFNAYLETGYAIRISEKFNTALLISPGINYSNNNFIVNIGYNIQQINQGGFRITENNNTIFENIYLRSIKFSIGLKL